MLEGDELTTMIRYNFFVNIANFYNTFVTGIAFSGAGWKVRNPHHSLLPHIALLLP
jgi:hypothetical protein